MDIDLVSIGKYKGKKDLRTFCSPNVPKTQLLELTPSVCDDYGNFQLDLNVIYAIRFVNKLLTSMSPMNIIVSVLDTVCNCTWNMLHYIN